MKTRYAAMWMAVAALSMVSVSAQGQKPSEPSKDMQHHQMMQGLTDAQFVPMMIKHHEQGIEMARLEEQRGSSASVKALAGKIRQSQEKELAELKGHAAHHGGATGTSGHAEHDKMMEQQGQAMMSTLKADTPLIRDTPAPCGPPPSAASSDSGG